jgi:hypothetical protein
MSTTAPKARQWDWVRLTQDVAGEVQRHVVPAGTIGTIIECHSDPERYSVDVHFSPPTGSGATIFDSLYLRPDQFELLPEPPPPLE